MDFCTYYSTLNESADTVALDTASTVAKYENFGHKLKDMYNLSSHDDSYVNFKMSLYFNNSMLYRFFFKTIHKSSTLKKITKLVNSKVFEFKPYQVSGTDMSYIAVEVVFKFKEIDKILDRVK